MHRLIGIMDALLEELQDLEKPVESPESATRAIELIAALEAYDRALRSLIHSHRIQEHLAVLDRAQYPQVVEWTGSIKTVFSELDELLTTIESDAKLLRSSVGGFINAPQSDAAQLNHRWQECVGSIALQVVTNRTRLDERRVNELLNSGKKVAHQLQETCVQLMDQPARRDLLEEQEGHLVNLMRELN